MFWPLPMATVTAAEWDIRNRRCKWNGGKFNAFIFERLSCENGLLARKQPQRHIRYVEPRIKVVH